ncbi:hypothetical protein KI387_043604, partial [Taxus chinensis]
RIFENPKRRNFSYNVDFTCLPNGKFQEQKRIQVIDFQDNLQNSLMPHILTAFTGFSRIS